MTWPLWPSPSRSSRSRRSSREGWNGCERGEHLAAGLLQILALVVALGFAWTYLALAFDTAASFVANANWQAYSGESTMGHLTQMAGLAVQNFASAAVGMAAAVALIRGFLRRGTDRIGNFWVDLFRGSFRIPLPIAAVGTVVLVASGVVQSLAGPHDVTTLAGGTQAVPGGPVASQEAIKELGTNGGGFWNANDRPGDAGRTLSADHLRPRARRVAGPSAAGAGHGGHAAHQPHAVRRPAGRRLLSSRSDAIRKLDRACWSVRR